MRYGERKTVVRDARLRTTATEDAIDGPIITPDTTTTSRDNADMSRNYSHIGHY